MIKNNKKDVKEKDNQENKEGDNSGFMLTLRGPLAMFADAALGVEKVRVAAQVRLTHLRNQSMFCQNTQELFERSNQLEEWVDTRLADLVRNHPTSPWLNRVKGTGGELIGKVLGLIERFGRFYPVDDPMIPPYVKRKPVLVPVKDNGKMVEKPMVWVEGIERCPTPSKLRKFAGLVPGLKREAGKKIEYNKKLKMALWRLGGSFLKSKNKYYDFYLEYKEHLHRRFEQEGVRIIPTPGGRYCISCEKEIIAKAAKFCPDCGEKLTLKHEPEGIRYEGHIHIMAQRRMLQLFLSHLWVVWREALNLPLRTPYPIEHLGHSQVLTPEDMADRFIGN